MTSPMLQPSQATLRDLFKYANGEMLWRTYPSQGRRKESAGCFSKGRNRTVIWITSCGGLFPRSRLVWIYHHGSIPAGYVLDHINGDSTNDRIENLRAVTQAVNLQNLHGPRKDNKVGVLGVCRKAVKYLAQIMVGGQSHHLGYHKTLGEASAAYQNAKQRLHPGCPTTKESEPTDAP